MTDHDLIARVTTVAERQHGVIRLVQFPATDHPRIRHLAERGVLERVATGLYRVCGSPPTWLQALQMGVWALGKEVAVSHASAARLHRFDRFEQVEAIEFTVMRGQRNRDVLVADAVVHSTTVRSSGDLRHVGGLPVTSPERTILDLARAGVATPLLEAAIDSAVRLRLTTLDHIIDRIDVCKGPARRGVARLDELVLTSGGHGVLERRFLELLRGAHCACRCRSTSFAPCNWRVCHARDAIVVLVVTQPLVRRTVWPSLAATPAPPRR